MNAYVALLRGINVGGQSSIDMKALKRLFESLGFLKVKTYINSGNVLFQSDTEASILKPLIEKAIQDHFGMTIPTILRSAQEIQFMVEAFPKDWKNDDEQRTDILFLFDNLDGPGALLQIKVNPQVDTLIALPKAIGWSLERKNLGKSGMKNFIGTTVYKNMTARNINTLRKLNALLTELI